MGVPGPGRRVFAGNQSGPGVGRGRYRHLGCVGSGRSVSSSPVTRDRGSLLVTDDPVVAIEQLWAWHLTLSAMLGPGPHNPESLAAGMEEYHGYG